MGMVRSVRTYLLEQGWAPLASGVPDAEDLWACDVGAARSFPKAQEAARSITRQALCPPNPKPFEIVTSSVASRLRLGT